MSRRWINGSSIVFGKSARTVATAAMNDDDFDVSRWLGEDDNAAASPPRKDASVGEDTMAGKSLQNNGRYTRSRYLRMKK